MSEIRPKTNIGLSAKKISAGWPKVGYDGENDEVRAFYTKISGSTTDRTSMFSKKRLADVFIFAMTLGKNAGISQKYEKKQDRRDTIDMEYIANQPEYLWMMIAIALEETKGDLTIFDEPRRIIDICEQYANYGIKLLINMDKHIATDPYKGYEDIFEKLLEKMKDDEMPNM